MLSQSDRSLTLKPVHRPSITSGIVAVGVNGPDCQDFINSHPKPSSMTHLNFQKRHFRMENSNVKARRK